MELGSQSTDLTLSSEMQPSSQSQPDLAVRLRKRRPDGQLLVSKCAVILSFCDTAPGTLAMPAIQRCSLRH